MQNTFADLIAMPAFIIVGCGILFFFIGVTIPKVRQLPASFFFVFFIIMAFGFELILKPVEKNLFFNMVHIDSYGTLFNQIFYFFMPINYIYGNGRRDLFDEFVAFAGIP